MLLTDGFGGFGGIAKFNRDFLQALSASAAVTNIHAWPRLIPEPIETPMPEKVDYDRDFAGSKYHYVAGLLRKLVGFPPVDLVICGHINLLPAAWLVAKARGAHLALIIHGIEAWQAPRNLATKILARRIDSLLSVSRHSASRFLSWTGLSEGRCTIIPNCVDLSIFTPGKKSEELEVRYGFTHARVLMTAGRLVSKARAKGFDEVIEVLPALLKRFANLKYLIIGDGPDRPRLMQKASMLGVSDKVVFAGRISEEEKVDHYRLADAYVMPSAGEGFGIVLIEAVACGVPTVGSKIDGSGEALLDGKLGRLVDPRSSDEIRAAVSEILDSPEPFLQPEDIRKFSVQAFEQRVDAWLRSVAESRADQPSEAKKP